MKYMQNLLFEIRDANFIRFREVNWLNALIYSICGTSLTVLNIIACSFFGKSVFAVVFAKVLNEFYSSLLGVVCVEFNSELSMLLYILLYI